MCIQALNWVSGVDFFTRFYTFYAFCSVTITTGRSRIIYVHFPRHLSRLLCNCVTDVLSIP